MAIEPAPSQQAKPASSFVDLNGYRLHYADWGGDPAKATFLLLHGGAANVHWWDYVAPQLIEEGRVIALDFRGHGESQWAAPAEYGPRGYVADTEAFIRWLGVPVILVGHSMGGMVAVWVATRHPELVRMLIIVDSPGGPPSFLRRLQWQWRRRSRGGPRPEMESSQEVVRRFHLVPGPSILGREALARLALESAEQLPSGRWAFRFDPQTRTWRRRGEAALPYPKLRTIVAPTLILKGGGSTILTRSMAHRLARRIRGGQLVEIPEAYHHVPLDCPEATAAAILKFVRAHRGQT